MKDIGQRRQFLCRVRMDYKVLLELKENQMEWEDDKKTEEIRPKEKEKKDEKLKIFNLKEEKTEEKRSTNDEENFIRTG